MLKLIETDAFLDGDEPVVRIIDNFDGSGLVKAAADSEIIRYVSGLTPEKGKTYVHILAMTASEYYGANKNADWWPEKNLIEHYKTFETSPAHIFRQHVNKDPARAIGQIIFAVYNKRMHRVELIGWFDNLKGADILEDINDGIWPKTSMAAKTPYDVCSICGNKAHTRQEYCMHLSEELGRVYPDGKKVCAINSGPLKFFDLSIVKIPADSNSSILQKVAAVKREEARGVVGSAELAEAAGLTEKQAKLHKLSEFVKEVTGIAVDSNPNLQAILDKVQDPPTEAMDMLTLYSTKDVLDSLARLGISPSIGWLSELIGRKAVGNKEGSGLGKIVQSYLTTHGAGNIPISDSTFIKSASLSEENVAIQRITHELSGFAKESSLFPEFVQERASYAPSYGLPQGEMLIPGTNVGYAQNGPNIEETPFEQFKRQNMMAGEAPGGKWSSIFKTILAVGGAALAAKWYITEVINQKMQEQQLAQREKALEMAQLRGLPVKIQVVEKRAEDYLSAYRLAKESMVRVIKGKSSSTRN